MKGISETEEHPDPSVLITSLDPDGDFVRAEFEIVPVGSEFTGVPTDVTPYQDGYMGGDQSFHGASLANLTSGVSYRIAYRVAEEYGVASEWSELCLGGGFYTAP